MPSDAESGSSTNDEFSFDPERCAELYNAVIQAGFKGSGQVEKGHRLQRNWFEVWRSDPELEKCRERLTPQFAAFLEQVDVKVNGDGTPAQDQALVYHLGPLPGPSWMMSELELSLFGCHGFDDMALLFPSNMWSISHRLGTFVDMDSMLVYYAPGMTDVNPDEERWWSLADYLERLLIAVHIGKYEPVHWEQESSCDCIVPGWRVNPWTESILEDTLIAYQELVQAITDRLPAGTVNAGNSVEDEQLATPQQLPATVTSFTRAFLTHAKRPPFKYIAPGLTVYNHTSPSRSLQTSGNDPEVYQTSNQNINRYFEVCHSPIVLFPAEMVTVDGKKPNDEYGLWILPSPEWADAVTLALPYVVKDLTSERCHSYQSAISLFQHDNCPFYTPHRTLLLTMLQRWTGLVESGVWKINNEGVEGGIEFYRQANEEGKRNWFNMGMSCFEPCRTEDRS